LFGLRDAESMMVVLAIALLVILRHRANIQRLLNGTETKISFGKKSA
jgi:glycerol-3-phosphate acyltransferase PlsY